MRRRFRVAGRVQGVGFRFFTQRTAAGLGLSGWVRNLRDGSVEAEAQGSADQLAEFEQRLRRGPTGSQVTEFDAIEISDQGDRLTRFEIRH